MLDSRDLVFHKITAVVPCIYVRAGHPLASQSAVTEEDLAQYPYVAFEQVQGVAADFSEEYQMVSMKRPERCISVNSRCIMMDVLSRTDGYTTGSGLLTEGLSPESVVTVPLPDKAPIRIGYILPRGLKTTPRMEHFISLLTSSIDQAALRTQGIHRSLGFDAAP